MVFLYHDYTWTLCSLVQKKLFLSDFFGTNSIKMGTVQWRMNGKTVLCYCSCWGLVCDLPPHGVSVVQSRKVWSKNCNRNLLHHRSEAVHQTEHAGLGLIKYKNLSSAMTNSRVWLGNGIQFPSLRRKQVLAPVVLLSHYASCALKVEPAPVNIPQRLSKKQKCRRKRKKTLWWNTNDPRRRWESDWHSTNYYVQSLVLYIHITC